MDAFCYFVITLICCVITKPMEEFCDSFCNAEIQCSMKKGAQTARLFKFGVN